MQEFTQNKSFYKLIFIYSLPLLIGYIPLGAAFGVLFCNLSLEWYYGIAMSVFIYAGAGQFLLIGLLGMHEGYIEIAVASFLLNFRHFFYSLSLLEEVREFGLWKYYVLFALTDETYAMLRTLGEYKNADFYDVSQNADLKKISFVMLSMLNHFYWVVGSAIGIYIGSSLDFSTQGIEFSLSALFVVLLLVLMRKNRSIRAVIVGGFIGILALVFFPKDKILLYSIPLGIFILVCWDKLCPINQQKGINE